VTEIPAGRDRNLVAALSRGIAVLDAYRDGDLWLGNAELAARSGLPRPTVSRIARVLAQLGYLAYSSRLRQYRLGVGTLALGFAVLADGDVRRVARPHMQALANQANALVALGARDGTKIVHIETCHSATSLVSLRLEVGTHARLAETAFGRALLTVLPEDERDKLLEHLGHLYGVRWPSLRDAVDSAFAEVARHGFCTILGRWQPDINAVGVPLRCPDGTKLALGLAGFAGQMTRKRLQDVIGPRLVEVARTIEAELARTSR
jgi:DNA-binding IclR family transcriptional regulator